MDLSVVIPLFNEQDAVAGLADEILRAVPESLTYEIVFIDDGSTDRTADVLRSVKERQLRVRVLRHAVQNETVKLVTGPGISHAQGLQDDQGFIQFQGPIHRSL